MELVLPLESRSFSGLVPPAPTYTSPHPQSQRHSDLGGTSDREEAAKRWGLQKCLQKAWSWGRQRREKIASEDPPAKQETHAQESLSSKKGRGDSFLPGSWSS